MDDELRFHARGILSGRTAGWRASSLALPSCDPVALRELRDLLHERLLLRLGVIRSRLSQLETRIRGAAWSLGLIERLLNLPPQARGPLLDSPRFGAWLEQTTCALNAVTSEAAPATRLDTLAVQLEGLSMLVLPIAFADCRLRSGTGALRWTSRVAPIGVRWQLGAAACDAPHRGDLEFHADGVRIVDGSRLLAEIPASAFAQTADGSEISLGDSRLEVGLRPFAAGGTVEIGSIEDYPELVEEWRMPHRADPALAARSIEGGMSELERVWPEGHADVRHFCRMVAPVLAVGARRRNATHPNLLYTQMITVDRGGALEHAEDLIHECSHSKLWCLRRLDPLTLNEDGERFRHPWRAEPRPMSGVFAGAHAFLAVMSLYQHAARSGPIARRARVRLETLTSEVGRALEVLDRGGKFTDNGRSVKDAMIDAYDRMTAG